MAGDTTQRTGIKILRFASRAIFLVGVIAALLLILTGFASIETRINVIYAILCLFICLFFYGVGEVLSMIAEKYLKKD